MKRSSVINILVIGGIVFVMLIIQAVLYSNPADTDETEANGNRSTYNSNTYGLKAIHDFLEESGYQVNRFRLPYTELESKHVKNLIVVSLPRYEPLSADEVKALNAWVEKGGQLVIADREIVLDFGPDIKVSTEGKSAKINQVRTQQASVLTFNAKDIRFSGSQTLVNITGGASISYIGNAEGSVLAGLSYGKGRVLFLTDPYVMADNGISKGDNLQLTLNIIRDIAPDKNVTFDEYHHGYGAKMQSGMIGYFSGTPINWMFGQFILLTLVIVYTNGRRFARPVPLKQEDRASSLEFVGSMAHLQNLAEASDLAIENIYGRFRKRLCRYAGQPTNASSRQLAESAGKRGKINPATLHKLLVRCEEVLAGASIKDDELLTITAKIRRWQNELGL